MKSPSPPPAPDPMVTAAAQSGMNRDTAQTQQLTNMINQVTPDGSLNYSRTGRNQFRDSQGRTVTIPMFTATQTLSPQQMEIYNLNKATEKNISTIGRDQSARIGDLLGTPIQIGNEATEARLFDLGSKRLNPRFASEEEALRTRLANSGIRAGSEAFDNEMRGLSEGKNDAYNSLLLGGRAQAVQESLAERNQPINEITALLSGSQVSQPNFVGTPSTQVGGVDYAGMVRDKHNSDMQAWQAKTNSNNAMMGGLFGLAAAPFQMFQFSDRRLKTGIKKVGKLDNGLPVYEYEYKAGGPPQIGLMAQDVEKKNPDAVATHPSGFKMVDYAQAVEG